MSFVNQRLFVDSANQEKVEELLSTGAFFGVTTNPTVLKRDGQTFADLPAINAWSRAAGAREVCFQTWGTTTSAILDNAARLLDVDSRVVVKVAMTRQGLPAAARLVADGAAVLMTAVYTSSQMLAACAAGVRYVAPYVGRMADTGLLDPLGEVVTMHRIAERSSTTQVLAASLRSAADVASLAAAGVPAFTLSPAVAWSLVDDSRSEDATRVFEETAVGLDRPHPQSDHALLGSP